MLSYKTNINLLTKKIKDISDISNDHELFIKYIYVLMKHFKLLSLGKHEIKFCYTILM